MKKLLISILLFPTLSFAQVDVNDMVKSNEGEPINITSENLIIKNKENVSVFEKNVHVTQGTMNLRANQMKVYSETNEETKKSTFVKIEASGNVDFVSGEKTAKSEQAIYDVKAGILKLTDNVRLTDADTVLQGRVFEYNIKTKLSKISNSGGAISASKASGDKNPDTKTQTGGRSKVTFTPGEGIKTIGIPMDTFGAMRGKAKDPAEADKKEEVKP